MKTSVQNKHLKHGRQRSVWTMILVFLYLGKHLLSLCVAGVGMGSGIHKRAPSWIRSIKTAAIQEKGLKFENKLKPGNH